MQGAGIGQPLHFFWLNKNKITLILCVSYLVIWAVVNIKAYHELKFPMDFLHVILVQVFSCFLLVGYFFISVSTTYFPISLPIIRPTSLSVLK